MRLNGEWRSSVDNSSTARPTVAVILGQDHTYTIQRRN